MNDDSLAGMLKQLGTRPLTHDPASFRECVWREIRGREPVVDQRNPHRLHALTTSWPEELQAVLPRMAYAALAVAIAIPWLLGVLLHSQQIQTPGERTLQVLDLSIFDPDASGSTDTSLIVRR